MSELRKNFKNIRSAKSELEKDLQIAICNIFEDFRKKYEIVPSDIYVEVIPITTFSKDEFGTYAINNVQIKFDLES